MRKETVIAGCVVALALLLIMVGVFWSPTPGRVVEQESVDVEVNGYTLSKDGGKDSGEDTVELPGRAVPDSYSNEDDGSRDVTRIVIVDPDGEEIADLLSEKVIINDEVVDQKSE